MSTSTQTIEEFVASDYKYGFVTNIESDTVPPGLSETTIRFISAKRTSRRGSPSGASKPSVTGRP